MEGMAVCASLVPAVVDTLFKELNLTPETILAKRNEMIARLASSFSRYLSPEAASASYNPTFTIPLSDSHLMNDVTLPIWIESNRFLIQTVYSCLVQAGLVGEAERYQENMATLLASGVEVESLKIWSLSTIHCTMRKKMGEMGFGATDGGSAFPSLEDLFPIPPPDYRASCSSRSNPAPCLEENNQNNELQDETEVAAETEDNTSTPMEETDPAGVVQIGEDAVQLMIDATQLMIDATPSVENQKDMIEEAESISSDTL